MPNTFESERWWPALDGTPRNDPDPDAGKAAEDHRQQFERERDRILYADEFERLRGVTQVVSPTEGILCHDRHSHSLRVEQLAMRMAVNGTLLGTRPSTAPPETPDPMVVAAASLAHDLGHPPFGHVAEQELDRLLRSEPYGDPDGYEGNAQSFRIITRLAVHRRDGLGLRLSRRVLRATLKYPWLSVGMPSAYSQGKRKYGAYMDDAKAFRFALEVGDDMDVAVRSIDAAVMDAADAITYSVHDLFDFYRANLIELGRLYELDADRIASIAGVQSFRKTETRAIRRLVSRFREWRSYDDTRTARADVQLLTSHLITTLVQAHRYRWRADSGWQLMPVGVAAPIMAFLQGLTRRYVIDSDTLSVTQIGHRRVVKRLFDIYVRALRRNEVRLFPAYARTDAVRLALDLRVASERHLGHSRNPGTEIPIEEVDRPLLQRCARLAADVIASLTDRQALALHARAAGLPPLDGFASQYDA